MIIKEIRYALFFLLVFASGAQATFLLDRVVAVVNQEVITWSELYRSMEMDAAPAVKALSEEERKRVFKENESVFLERLIALRLQIQEAANNKFRVTNEEVLETIGGIKKKYGMTEEQFQSSLKAEGYSFDEYKRRLSDQILQTKIVSQQVRSKILVTDADIDSFMKDSRELSGSVQTIRISQIFFKKPQEDAEKVKIEEKALAVYAKAKEGENFAELARKHSEDPTRNTGGDLGYVDKRSLAREFSTALTSLKQGEVSKPFWSDKGMHILRLDEMAAPKSSAELREEAKAVLQDKLFTEKYNAWIRSLREKSFIDIRL